jgi:uncharacterized Zn finger protein
VFHLLAESFDTDPFAILGWRGRDRDDLLAALNALRSGSLPAADHTQRDGAAVPLTEVMPTYFSLQGTIPLRGPAQTRSDSVLDQLPPPGWSFAARIRPHPVRLAFHSRRGGGA